MENNQTRLEIMWGTALLDEGFTSIPNFLIRNYRKLKLQHGEWGFICTLLTYKHDTKDPYPSRKTLADHLMVSERQIDKWVKSLKEKRLLRTGRRRNVHTKHWNTTVYNFKPLLDKALTIIGKEILPNEDSFEIEWDDEPTVPEVRVGTVPEVRMGTVPEVRIKKKREKEKRKDDDIKYLIENFNLSNLNKKAIDLLSSLIEKEQITDSELINRIIKKLEDRNPKSMKYLYEVLKTVKLEIESEKNNIVYQKRRLPKNNRIAKIPDYILNQPKNNKKEVVNSASIEKINELLKELGEL